MSNLSHCFTVKKLGFLKSRKIRSLWPLLVLFVGLLFPACSGISQPQYLLNNEIRLAVFEYEREVRGSVDDLVIHFRSDELRIRFEGQNQNSGRTIWLFPGAAAEYFATRPVSRTYLYIQQIEYTSDFSQATVPIYRGDGFGYEGRMLMLAKTEEGRWTVSSDTKISDAPESVSQPPH